MRGGAQAHSIEAADDHCYVVKFLNNPQHRRILVNEWIASVFLRYLGISTPEAAVIRVTQDEEFRRELCARGRARAALFTWARTARATMDVYQTCLAQGAKRTRQKVTRTT